MSEEIKAMKQTLMAAAQSQMGNLSRVNTKELGEVIDMIKDLEEAEYYCSIVKAMEENSSKENEQRFYYTPYYYPDRRYDYMDDTKMYYTPTTNSYPSEMRDYREGKSPISRKGYIESKEMNQDSSVQINKLEKYINELTNDIIEMTADSSPQEKALLHQKLTNLANKIQ